MLTRGITIYNSRNTTLRNSLLCNMTYPTILSSSDPSGLPAIIELYFSSFQLFQSTFEKNSMSSIKAFASSISVHSSASFHNHARDIGGVFYISTKPHYYTHHSTIANNYIASQTICFLAVEGNRLHTQLSFVNNTAERWGCNLRWRFRIRMGWRFKLLTWFQEHIKRFTKHLVSHLFCPFTSMFV